MESKIKKEKTRKSTSYKLTVFCYVFLLIAILLLTFLAYVYYDYLKECQEVAQKEATTKAGRIVDQNDEKLGNLRQYYEGMSSDESIKWLLENDIDYSDYSDYKAAYDDMGSRGIFKNYLNGYAFINFKTGWVLSNKGMYRLHETYNKDQVMEVYEDKLDLEKFYWDYFPDGMTFANIINRQYRVTVETKGLNFVMHLPAGTYNTYAVFIANVDEDAWKNWMSQWTEEYEKVVVLDQNGNLIYTMDESLTDSCLKLYEENLTSGQVKISNVDYRIGYARSGILGWNYYLYRDVDGGQTAIRQPVAIIILFLMLVIVCFLLISNKLYKPIDSLVRNVTGTGAGDKFKITGSELEYLAGSYHSLEQSKQTLAKNNEALMGLLGKQREKLMELFELRLLHGEVKSEEWDAYIEQFELRGFRYFATAVVILKLGDEETPNIVDEDAICLQLLTNLPDEIKLKAWMPPIYNSSAVFAIFAEDDESVMLEKIREFYRQMKEYTLKTFGLDIMVGVSATHTNYKHIRAAYRESVNALTYKVYTNTEESEDVPNAEEECYFYLASTTVLNKEYNRQFEEEIETAVKAVDKQECYRIVNNFCLFLNHNQGHEAELPLYLLRFVNTILVTGVNAGICLNEVYPNGMRKIYRELLEVVEPDRERRYIKTKFVDPVIKARTDYLEQYSHSMLEEIEKLIAEKKGDISLTECAEILGVHQTYIWKVLKTERDKSFSDYVEEYKLKEAKRLLLESDLTVAEISERLNYTNAQNFIRFFSKSTGVTPGKFRKL